jgi:VWFA-related protein
MARILLVFTVLLGLFWAFGVSSQTQPTQPQDRPVIRTTTREVVLDLVVRDKHHHAVTDLRPEEIEVFEDGVKQNVRAFRIVGGPEQLQTERTLAATQKAASPDSPENPSPINSLRQVNFVSVVFADIAPLNLEFSRRAVREFLKSDTLPNTFVTVYQLNQNLRLVQPFTKDKDILAKAVDQAAKGLTTRTEASSSASVISSNQAALMATSANIMASPLTGAAQVQQVQNALLNPLLTLSKDPLWAANASSQDVSVTLGNALLAQAQLAKGLRFVSSISNGMDAMDTLRDLVRSEEQLPGRKVVLYLADGLTLPMNRREVVDDLISYANRSGVSFYTVDTRGLNVDNPMIEALAAQKRVAAESSAQLADPENGHREDDDVQLTAVASKQLAMRELAESTGGFAVTNTNEIALPMQRMMEDIREHYELAYAPTSTIYDGHFRKIEVKVSRSKVTVQTRKGYYAVPDLNGEPLQPYELLALNAMNAQPAAPLFPYEFAAMKFRPEQQAVQYELTFEIPLSGLKAVPDPKTGTSRYQAALVAFIHDESGGVVWKVSRELARETPSASESGRERILYAEPVDLPSGHYVIDTAVTDEQTGKTSVKRVALYVEKGKDLALSSLELVRRFEPLTGPRNLASPFELENGKITPMLNESVSPGTPVSLYFVLYPSNPGQTETPHVLLQMLRDGKEVARKPLNVSSPNADGSIPMLVEFSPEAGECDVLITAKQGTAVAQSSLSMRVE